MDKLSALPTWEFFFSSILEENDLLVLNLIKPIVHRWVLMDTTKEQMTSIIRQKAKFVSLVVRYNGGLLSF